MKKSCGCNGKGGCARAYAVTREESALYTTRAGSAESNGGFIPVDTTFADAETKTTAATCTACQQRRSAAGSAIFSAPGISMPGVTRMGRDSYHT